MLNVNVDSKFYADHKVIGDLNFIVEPTEIVALVGPSGAGKSTLLNIIAGLDTLFRGSISLSSQSNLTPHLQAKQSISYMFQEPRLLPWRTVLKNVCLVGDETDKSNQERAESLLKAVGLAEQLNVYPGQLSGGMKRRVSLARAFLPKPKLLMMDEPFISLDVPSAESLRASFLELWQECGSSVIYVTHDLGEALAVADRVLFLSASPATVILEVVVDDKRPGANRAKCVQTLQNDLLSEHPRLLEGWC